MIPISLSEYRKAKKDKLHPLHDMVMKQEEENMKRDLDKDLREGTADYFIQNFKKEDI